MCLTVHTSVYRADHSALNVGVRCDVCALRHRRHFSIISHISCWFLGGTREILLLKDPADLHAAKRY